MMNGDRAAYGDPRLPERFWMKVAVDAVGCWGWTAQRNSNGYGLYFAEGRSRLAHRVAWSALVEVLPRHVPGGPQLDHLCRNRACCNPAHLELVSPRENQMRGRTFTAEQSARTTCPRGHALKDENLIPSGLRLGHRQCFTCLRWRGLVVGEAARALGLTRAEYAATYGWGRIAAERVLRSLSEPA